MKTSKVTIMRMPYIDDYFYYYQEGRVNVKRYFYYFKKRIKCWRDGHNLVLYCDSGNTYNYRCKNCGKRYTLTLKKDTYLNI